MGERMRLRWGRSRQSEPQGESCKFHLFEDRSVLTEPRAQQADVLHHMAAAWMLRIKNYVRLLRY
jgi:hypothetical protein